MNKKKNSTGSAAPYRPADINELKRLLNGPGIKVSDLKYSDVLFDALSCHCIYAFCEGENYKLYEVSSEHEVNLEHKDESVKYWYIGSNVSGALVSRLGAHFAPRINDYANGLLKHIAYVIANKKQSYKKWCDEAVLGENVKQTNELIAKAFPIMKDLVLKIIYFEENEDGELSEDIQEMEKALILKLRPAFNYPKRSGDRQFVIKDINGNQILN